VVSPAMVLFGRANFEGIFGARSVDLGGFFIDMRSSVVVSDFLRSDCVKPRPWWSLLLGVWPARTMEFSPAGLAREDHSLSFRWWLMEIGGFERLSLLKRF
jgi:hypothetical protein